MDITYRTVSKMAERWGFDYCDEYGEPGYDLPYGAADHAGIILGDFWCRCGKVQERFDAGASRWTMIGADDPTAPGERRPALHGYEMHYPRLFAALEEQGWQLEWCDEWVIDWEGASKAYRTQGDSYGWQPSLVFVEDGYLTPDDELERWVDAMGNDPAMYITARAFRAVDLIEAGFVKWEPDDPHTYEAGWHPGQTDDPREITRQIREATGLDDDELTIVFYLDSTGQFDVRFSAWTRETNDDA